MIPLRQTSKPKPVSNLTPPPKEVRRQQKPQYIPPPPPPRKQKFIPPPPSPSPPPPQRRNTVQETASSRDEELLQRLELEISDQESQWKRIRHTLTLRDSLDSTDSRKPSTLRISRDFMDDDNTSQLDMAEYRVSSDSEKESAVANEEDINIDVVVPLLPTVYVDPAFFTKNSMGSLNGIQEEYIDEISDSEEELYFEPSEFSKSPVALVLQPTNSQLWRSSVPKDLPNQQSPPHLWAGKAFPPTAVFPAALETRPMKRFDTSLQEPANSRLWIKPRRNPTDSYQKGLWKDPRAPWKPRGIITTTARRFGRRVVFDEDVATGMIALLNISR